MENYETWAAENSGGVLSVATNNFVLANFVELHVCRLYLLFELFLSWRKLYKWAISLHVCTETAVKMLQIILFHRAKCGTFIHRCIQWSYCFIFFAFFFLLLYTCSPGLYCINGQCFHQYILGCFKRSLHLWSNLLHVKLNHGAV